MVHFTLCFKSLGDDVKREVFTPQNITPIVSAKAWAVVNAKNGKVILSKNKDDRREIASLTKIMNIVTVFKLVRQFDLDLYRTKLSATRNAAYINGTRANLQEGDSLYLWDLLHGLMLPSGNDAAICLAEYFGLLIYSAQNPSSIVPPKYPSKLFVTEMNINAMLLKLTQTTFANPHGLSNFNNKSSAGDMGRLAAFAMKNSKFREIVSCREYICTGYDREEKCKTFKWTNTNKMLDYDGYNGIKTGVTPAAGPCLASCYEKADLHIITILISSRSMEHRWVETKRLVKWAGVKHKLDIAHQNAKENATITHHSNNNPNRIEVFKHKPVIINNYRYKN
jgi:serine-type D-Ala-D-Ala carboxypeptidase (penicillin-binding protein 5/6)